MFLAEYAMFYHRVGVPNVNDETDVFSEALAGIADSMSLAERNPCAVRGPGAPPIMIALDGVLRDEI